MSGGGDADVARGRVREAQPHSAVMDTEGITQLGKNGDGVRWIRAKMVTGVRRVKKISRMGVRGSAGGSGVKKKFSHCRVTRELL